jgi:THO complex subunit 5
LARLEWELRQRRELAGACNELNASKERVSAAIAAARSRLDALSPHLRDVLKSTKPLQECLALRLDEKRDEARVASLLPHPLFLLYANSSAYSDALGAKTVSVSKFQNTYSHCLHCKTFYFTQNMAYHTIHFIMR